MEREIRTDINKILNITSSTISREVTFHFISNRSFFSSRFIPCLIQRFQYQRDLFFFFFFDPPCDKRQKLNPDNRFNDSASNNKRVKGRKRASRFERTSQVVFLSSLSNMRETFFYRGTFFCRTRTQEEEEEEEESANEDKGEDEAHEKRGGGMMKTLPSSPL